MYTNYTLDGITQSQAEGYIQWYLFTSTSQYKASYKMGRHASRKVVKTIRSTVLQWSLVLLHFMYTLFFGWILFLLIIYLSQQPHNTANSGGVGWVQCRTSKEWSSIGNADPLRNKTTTIKTNKLKWLDSTTLSRWAAQRYVPHPRPTTENEKRKQRILPFRQRKYIHPSTYLLTSLFFFQYIFFGYDSFISTFLPVANLRLQSLGKAQLIPL